MSGTAVPSKRISDLPVAAPITGSEVMPAVQNGETVKVALSDLVAFVIERSKT